MSRSADVLIIGAGLIGLNIARVLTRSGLRVVVLERGEPGKEASWAGAGMLVPDCEFDAVDVFSDLCHRSLSMYPAFIRQLEEESGISIEYRTEGVLMPAFSDRDQAGLEGRQTRQSAAGIRVERLTARETRRIEPNLSGKMQMALFYPDNHQVENRHILQALIQTITGSESAIRGGVTVTRLVHEKSRVTGLETSEGLWQSPRIINAAGCWSRYLSGLPPGAIPPVRPVRGQMLSLSTDEAPFRRTIYAGKTYLIPRSGGRLLVGATAEEAGFRKTVTVSGVLRLLKGAIDVAPSLKDAAIEATWAGLRPATPDGWPVLGPTRIEGFHLATGHFRNGILLTPVTGALMADLIMKGETPDLMRPFLIDRFLE
jgi:glycine oxidase